MDRRGFLRALLALPIAATLDVEQMLWVPGQMVTVPAMPTLCPAVIRDEFFRSSPLLAYIREHVEVTRYDRAWDGSLIWMPASALTAPEIGS